MRAEDAAMTTTNPAACPECGQWIEPEHGPVRAEPDDGRRWHRHGVPPGTTAWCRADLPTVTGRRGCGMDHLTWVELLAAAGRVVAVNEAGLDTGGGESRG